MARSILAAHQQAVTAIQFFLNIMKKNLSVGLITLCGLAYSQVGIGTTNPVEKLEIVGATAIGTSVTVDPTNYVNNASGFTVVGTDPQSSTVGGKVIALETLYTPLTIQPYEINNIYRDDINDLNLNIPTDKYFITIANFEAIPSAGNNGIFTNTAANPVSKGHFVIDAFASGANWHVKIGYPTLNTQSTADRYTYKFDIIIYSKRFYKNLGTLEYNLNGQNNGTTSGPPTGI